MKATAWLLRRSRHALLSTTQVMPFSWLFHYCTRICRRLHYPSIGQEKRAHEEAHVSHMEALSSIAHGHGKAIPSSCSHHWAPVSHEEGCETPSMDQVKEAHEEAWETLVSHMSTVADGREDDALEPLERVVDQLEGCASPCDLRLCGAWFMLSTAYASSKRLQPEKCLFYALKALKGYGPHKAHALRFAECLYLSGYAYFMMVKCEDAVSQLEKCTSFLSKTTEFSECRDAVKFKAQYLTGQAKMRLGKWKEAIDDFHKALELKQKMLPCMELELGPIYLRIAYAYRVVKDHDGAMRFYNTAIELFTTCYGPGSLEVAEARLLRSAIYYDMEKYKDTVTECEAVRPTLEQFGKSAQADVLVARTLFHLQYMEEAIWRLEQVIKDTPPETSKYHFEALVYLARFCCVMKNGAGAANYCQKALDLLPNKNLKASATDYATLLTILSQVLEVQQKSEQAAKWWKQAQKLLELYDADNNFSTIIADNDGKLGCLLLCDANEAQEAIRYLEYSVSRKISIYGPRNKELLLPYMHLGMAYSQVGRLNEAFKQFKVATAILLKNGDVGRLKPVINSFFASIYKGLGRLDKAIEYQKVAVASMKKMKNAEELQQEKAKLEAYMK